VLCGARSYAAIAQWAHNQDTALMHGLGFTRWPPKTAGIRKLLTARDVAASEAVLTRWADAMLGWPVFTAPSPPAAFDVDGESAQGTGDGVDEACICPR
jgi:hypothetical protein